MAIALVNGINYSSVNVQVIIPLIGPVIGVTKITATKEKVIEDNYSLGADATSRAYGLNKYSGSISLYWEIVNKIIDKSPLKDPLALPPFEITIILGGSATGGYRKIVLHACNFTSLSFSVGSGDTKILSDIPLAIGGIDFV